MFILTKGGDIKPARFAKIYVLYVRRTLEAGAKRSEAEQNEVRVALVWLDAVANALAERKKLLAEAVGGQNSGIDSDQRWAALLCRTGLLAYEKGLDGVLRWALDNPKKADQMIRADSDEEGRFKISVPPAEYYLVVRGRAGSYEAVWEEHDLTVTSGMETNIALGSPKEACLDM